MDQKINNLIYNVINNLILGIAGYEWELYNKNYKNYYQIKYLKIKHSRYARCQWAHNNQVGMCPHVERYHAVPRSYDLY